MTVKLMALIIGCAVTLILFVTMSILMSSVNPPPLPIEPLPEQQPNLTRRAMFDPDTDIIIPPLGRPGSQHNYYSVTDDYNSLVLYTVRRVVPPLWPTTPDPPPKEAANLCTGVSQAASEENETIIFIDKRSVDNDETNTNDTDSIVLKLTDDSSQFNIEIKIRPNDPSTKKKVKTRKIKPKDIRKYSMSLKTKSNELFKISELAKNTAIHVNQNDSVSIDEYDDYLKSDNQTVKEDDEIQGSIDNLINNTTSNKPEEMPINKDSWPFYSNMNKRDLLQKQNNTPHTNFNHLDTINNTANNLTMLNENKTLQNFATTPDDNVTISILL